MALLELKDVSMIYNGKVKALEGINLESTKVNGWQLWDLAALARQR